MMSAKMATVSLFKKKVFWNKGYDAITYIYDVMKKFHHMNQIIL